MPSLSFAIAGGAHDNFMRTSTKIIMSYAPAIILATVLAVGLLLVIGDGISGERIKHLPQQIFCLDESNYSSLSAKNKVIEQGADTLNADGTIRYYYDNFDRYSDTTVVIESFENTEWAQISGPVQSIEPSRLRINGEKSLKVTLADTGRLNVAEMRITNTSQRELDLGKWENQGIFSLWLHVPDQDIFNSASMRFIDGNGNIRKFNAIENPQLGIPNFFDRDDAYPDLPFKNQESSADEWTDYQIVEGWNFLFWRNEQAFYTDKGPFNARDIRHFEVSITVNPGEGNGDIYVDDLRLITGLQKDDNVLAPNWYPPHGRPQYGVFELDSDIENGGSIKLINIRQSQYPSNGDRARMIAKGLTPENFIIRVRFKTEDIGTSGDLTNTWFRLTYDFDTEWDPGHDWFGFYSSLEWQKAGLITVIPVQRFYLQDQEPKNENIDVSSVPFKMRDEATYEVQLEVRGQNATAWVYTVGDECLKLKEKVSYEFQRQRHADKRYPIAIEATGDMKIRVYEVEIAEIDKI